MINGTQWPSMTGRLAQQNVTDNTRGGAGQCANYSTVFGVSRRRYFYGR